MQKTILDKFRAYSTEKFIPLQASLELTYRCNERCTHCYIEEFKDNPDRVLGLQEWTQVLKELRSAGTLYLILMGGEPMLSPLFWSISQTASDMGFHVSIISNGQKIKDLYTAKRLKESGVQLVTFSLYSLDEKVHDKMTAVKGSHEKLMKAIQFCLEAGVTVSINSLLTEANAKGVFDLYDWCQKNSLELKVDPNITPKLNGDLKPTKYRASKETLYWFYSERARRWAKSLPSPSMDNMDSYVCNAAKGKCAVNPYGELLPCIEVRESMGSLVTEKFSDIWNSDSAQKWRQPKVKDLKDIGSLELYGHCEHCPGMAKNEHGDPMKPTCYSKQVAEVKQQVFKEFQQEAKVPTDEIRDRV